MRIRISMKSLLSSVALVMGLPLGAAQALSVDSATSTLTDAQICSASTVIGCLTPVGQLSGAATVSGGSVSISGSTLNFSFSVPTAIFNGSAGAVTLSNVTYSGSLALTTGGPNQYFFQDQLSTIGGTAASSSGSTNFLGAAVNTTGQCTGTPGTSLLCGFLFGPNGSSVSIAGSTRYLRQSVNITAVPEPGTAILLGLGLTALAASRRA